MERRRLNQRDEHRWRQSCAFATDWQERTRLLTFLAEVENRSRAEANATIASLSRRADNRGPRHREVSFERTIPESR